MKDIKKRFQAGLAFFLLFSNLLALGQEMKFTPRIEIHSHPAIDQYHLSDLHLFSPDITQFRAQDLIRSDYVFVQRDDHLLDNVVNQRLIYQDNTKRVQIKDNR